RLVQELGVGHWSPIARQLNLATGKDDSCGRIGKQCRERWNHHLRPGICKAAWSPEEELALVKAHRVLGNRWSDIARSIEGRSENSVKNVWFATLRRR
ncbi:Homeodomain-like protein, partial [Haematococcus lacustris]